MFTAHAAPVVGALGAAPVEVGIALGDAVGRHVGAAVGHRVGDVVGLLSIDPALAPLQSEDDDNPFVMILFLAGFGAMALYGGWQRYQTSRLVANTPTEKVRSMAVGRTELEGQAWPIDEPFDEPFGDGEAVVATYEVEVYEEDDDGDGKEWNTKEYEKLTEPFHLDDGTGEALIDTDADDPDLHISDDNTRQVTVGSTEEEPPEIEEFLREHSSLAPTDGGLRGAVFQKKRRYTQEVLPPGEETYVFGDAEIREEESGSNEERLVINEDDMTERFIVSDMGEDELSSALGRKALGTIALGVLLLTAAFYVLLTQVLFLG